MLYTLIALYFVIGLVLAKLIAPYSFPFHINSILITFLWPWFIAAQTVKMITGKYPKWTPYI